MNTHSSADSVKTMIGEAYSRLPGPDPIRLNMIERRLVEQFPAVSRRRSRARVTWWGFGLLAFAAGAAAWWAISRHEIVEPLSPPPSMEQELSAPLNDEPSSSRQGVIDRPQANTDTRTQEVAKNPHKSQSQPTQRPDDNSAVIYKREVY